MVLEAIKRINALAEDVPTYNKMLPQYALQGNTPEETFSGKPYVKEENRISQKENPKKTFNHLSDNSKSQRI